MKDSASLRILIGVALLFALISWSSGLRIGGIVVLCFIAAYATEFYFFRLIAAAVQRRRPSLIDVVLGAGAILINAALIYAGFWLPLGLAIGVMLITDGVVFYWSRQ